MMKYYIKQDDFGLCWEISETPQLGIPPIEVELSTTEYAEIVRAMNIFEAAQKKLHKLATDRGARPVLMGVQLNALR